MRRGALAALLALAACARSAGPDSTVALEYELSSGGALIEASPKGEPLVVTLGTGGLPEAVEAELLGLEPGTEKTVELPPEKAFGVYDAAKVTAVPLGAFGGMAARLKPGATVAGTRGGRAAEARVVKIEKGAAVLDFNHPLAGKALRYRLKLLAVK